MNFSIKNLERIAMEAILKENPNITTGEFAKALNKKINNYKFILGSL